MVVLGIPLLLVRPAHGDEPPAKRVWQGIVVSRGDGQPVAGVPVVMAHGRKGYILFTEGSLDVHGEEEKILRFFAKRNARSFCVARTDHAGRFTFSEFGDPEGRWCVAAGDAEHGLALRLDVRPQDFASEPLRLELEPPAFINAKLPSAAAAELQLRVQVTLAPAATPGAESPPSVAEEASDDDVRDHVHFVPRSFGRSRPGQTERQGPFPAGYEYHVVVLGTNNRLPYSAALFRRAVHLEAGTTVDVALESAEGATVSGRITSSDDKPLADVNVYVKAGDGLLIGALTDAEGKYDLRGVPAGTHELKLLRHAARKTPG